MFHESLPMHCLLCLSYAWLAYPTVFSFPLEDLKSEFHILISQANSSFLPVPSFIDTSKLLSRKFQLHQSRLKLHFKAPLLPIHVAFFILQCLSGIRFSFTKANSQLSWCRFLIGHFISNLPQAFLPCTNKDYQLYLFVLFFLLLTYDHTSAQRWHLIKPTFV